MVLKAVLIFSLMTIVIGECTFDSDRYAAYRGCASRGHNQEFCGNWLHANMWGDVDFIQKDEAYANGIGDHTNCRNPGGKRYGAWCYQAYKNIKIYCAGVNDTACFTRPEDDPKCPEFNKKRSGTVEPQPEVEEMNAMFGGTLNLLCKEGCTEEVQWKSRPGLNGDRLSTNSLIINPVTNDTRGEWHCTCGRRRYVKNVEVCTLTWSGCRLVGRDWKKDWVNSCGGTGSNTCIPSKEENTPDKGREGSKDRNNIPDRSNDYDWSKEGESGEAQARKEGGEDEEQEESCVGSECSFCHNNSLICGAMGCLAGAVTVVAAVFVRKSLKWKKKAKEYRPSNVHTLETQLSGSQAYSRQTAERAELSYDDEQALKISLVSQLNSKRREPGLSCSTSVTDTMHLRHLRQHNHLGMIQSEELYSTDNIDCLRYQEEDELSHHSVRAPRNDGDTIYQDDAATLESERSQVGRHGFEDAMGHRDGTLFDKYYDQDVEKWSIKEEVEI